MSSLNVKTHIRLHTPDGRVQKILTSRDRRQILDSLPRLFEVVSSPMKLGEGFSLEVGVSKNTHVFVVRERRAHDDLIADVFAIRRESQEEEEGGGLDGLLSPDEVFNLALLYYRSDFVAEEEGGRSLTAYSDCTASNGSEYCQEIIVLDVANNGVMQHSLKGREHPLPPNNLALCS